MEITGAMEDGFSMYLTIRSIKVLLRIAHIPLRRGAVAANPMVETIKYQAIKEEHLLDVTL